MSTLPIITIIEEPNEPEFLETYTPILIRIKHPYHHLNRMRIETRKISIDQRLSELPLGQLAYPRYVDCLEKREK